MNYTSLVQAIQDYSENTEQLFVANINTFLSQAELRIYNSVQIPVLRKNVTGAVTTSNPYLSCPDDFMAVYSLAAINASGSYNYLIDKDVSFVREAYPNPSVTGLPKYYAIFGSQLTYPTELSLILTPTPDDNYSVELHYYYMPESITVAASGTTWLSDNYDPVLFYGAMREAMIFMKGEADMVGYYENKYQEALGQLKRLGDGLERGDSYRNNQTKLPYSSL
jgi:hypothetical protein